MTENPHELRSFLERHLERQVLSFWLNHGVDFDKGGLFSFLRRNGKIFDRRKSVTSNARALWTFSALARHYPERPDLRKAADGIFNFLERYGRDQNGLWNFLLGENGERILGSRSIITGAFAIYGLVEYYRLTGLQQALDMALQSYYVCRDYLTSPGTYQTVLYPTPPGMKAHRESMQFSLVLFELAKVTRDRDILEQALLHSDRVLNVFYRPDRRVLLEYIGGDDDPLDNPEGRTMVPGHGIESLWFQIHLRSDDLVRDTESAGRAAEGMRFCLEKGWDSEFGGLFLGIDTDGHKPPYWKMPEIKRWWPHCEALCGTLLAYEQTGEAWCLDWYDRIHEWAFSHFPDPDHGEWRQNLDRSGEVFQFEGIEEADLMDLDRLSEATGVSRDWLLYDFLVQDPFHLPRALIFAIETLDRLCRDTH